MGGWGAATQTFAPGGKYPRAATEFRRVYDFFQSVLQRLKDQIQYTGVKSWWTGPWSPISVVVRLYDQRK